MCVIHSFKISIRIRICSHLRQSSSAGWMTGLMQWVVSVLVELQIMTTFKMFHFASVFVSAVSVEAGGCGGGWRKTRRWKTGIRCRLNCSFMCLLICGDRIFLWSMVIGVLYWGLLRKRVRGWHVCYTWTTSFEKAKCHFSQAITHNIYMHCTFWLFCIFGLK